MNTIIEHLSSIYIVALQTLSHISYITKMTKKCTDLRTALQSLIMRGH